jgi:hypothetical protein
MSSLNLLSRSARHWQDKAIIKALVIIKEAWHKYPFFGAFSILDSLVHGVNNLSMRVKTEQDPLKTQKERIMKKLFYLFLPMAFLGLTLLFTACEKKGPAEKTGEKIDQAVEETKERVEETTEEMMGEEGPAEKAGEKIDEAVEETGEAIKETTE